MGNRPAFYTFLEKIYIQFGNGRMQIQSGDLNRRQNRQTALNYATVDALIPQYQNREIDLNALLDGIAAIYDYKSGACR